MSTLPHPDGLAQDERAALDEAERRGTPFLLFREPEGPLRVIELDALHGAYTLGRRPEADIPLPWDREVSRLHAELRRLAGEWTIADDGLSQNGTFVNETRLVARRRLTDGDMVRLGKTCLTFRDPSSGAAGLTLLPGELNAATALSEQQHLILRELCRPLPAGGPAADDEQIAAALALPVEVVATEMLGLMGAFGLDDVPSAEARQEIAEAALGSGLVSFD